MKNKLPICGTAETWESGTLGLTAKHARRVQDSLVSEIDAALGLQAISIRVHKSTIDTFKMLAKIHNVGYQPLMRDALARFADSEMKRLLAGAVEDQRQSQAQVGSSTDCAAATPPMPKAA